MRKHHVALVYNAYPIAAPDSPQDRGSMDDLKKMMRRMARILRRAGYKVTLVPLSNDMLAFQRRLRRLRPDVVFNQYDDVVHGALYEMRLAALVQMMGFPMTGSPALALGLGRYKFMAAGILHGAGVPLPPDTRLIERIGDIDRYHWRFPVIVQPGQEHAGIGLDRGSVIYTRKDLKARVRMLLTDYSQPALVQKFLPGREFNVGLLGGRRLQVLPLAEVDYSRLPDNIPPIMSYAAKWLEDTVEYRNTGIICPADVDPWLAKEISSIALRAFRAVGGRGYGRVDIRLDENGEPRVLEVNCNSSLEEDVALARAAKQAGYDYPQLLQKIVRIAMEGPAYDVGMPML